MISSKSLKYTVRILLGTLIGVYLGIIVLLTYRMFRAIYLIL